MNFTRAHTKHKETGQQTFLCTRLSLSVTTHSQLQRKFSLKNSFHLTSTHNLKFIRPKQVKVNIYKQLYSLEFLNIHTCLIMRSNNFQILKINTGERRVRKTLRNFQDAENKNEHLNQSFSKLGAMHATLERNNRCGTITTVIIIITITKPTIW